MRTPSSTKSTPEVIAPATTGLKYAQAAAAGVSTSGSHDSLSKKQDKTPGANDKPVENAWTKPPEIIDQAKEDKQRHQHVIQQPGAALLSSQYPAKVRLLLFDTWPLIDTYFYSFISHLTLPVYHPI